jgi:hypothetical protein
MILTISNVLILSNNTITPLSALWNRLQHHTPIYMPRELWLQDDTAMLGLVESVVIKHRAMTQTNAHIPISIPFNLARLNRSTDSI